MSPLVVVVFLYPLILVGVSVWRARSVKSHEDFMVAGRSVAVPLLVGTLVRRGRAALVLSYSKKSLCSPDGSPSARSEVRTRRAQAAASM